MKPVNGIIRRPRRSGRDRTVLEKKAEKIALDTLRMPDPMVGVMGGMSKSEARDFLRSIGYSKSRLRKLEAGQKGGRTRMKRRARTKERASRRRRARERVAVPDYTVETVGQVLDQCAEFMSSARQARDVAHDLCQCIPPDDQNILDKGYQIQELADDFVQQASAVMKNLKTGVKRRTVIGSSRRRRRSRSRR